MELKERPMPSAIPHLHFKGNCSEAFRFYAATFGGKIVFSVTYGETPDAGKTPPEARSQIAHARLDLGDQFLLGCDVTGDHYERPQGFNLMANADEPADAERLFRTLAEGGTVTMPVQETFWARRFGMCTDRFGTPWMVNCAKPMDAAATPAARSA
jgi:PhnB protein